MSHIRPLDTAFPITQQIEVAASPVVLINVFSIDAADVDIFLGVWRDDALWMKSQPGFISTQLHRAIGKSNVFVNYAVWESTEQFRRAFTNPDFRAKIAAYPSSAVISPHLFQKVRVADVCVA